MSLMSIRNLSRSFGGVHALRNVSLEVPEGIILGLIGPNGAGKTTLINVISGLIPPSAGSLSFNGRDNGPWPMARSVGYGIARTFQQTRVFMGLTVRENLRIAAEAGHGLNRDVAVDPGLDLAPFYDRVAGELPYGVLRRLGMALALAVGPRMLLLDEPAVGLTSDEIAGMGRAIRRANDSGLTIILVEHNVRFLMEIAQHVAVMDRGQLLFQGSPAECQGNQAVIDVYLGKGQADAEH
ncbi:ABC transporter ATP-binding protein [Pigmentiphaga aceris]|uniref:ABC transporter ATP-binding protein n=1 Tax=Pigmentiphaga aceris TaxID=1940612 RepID=A0A5C0AVE8_9BURK|nr:ABC transporter ATP-binding protein [Pigmentiphaga aceris]QEI04641.1 ABC transporter ATP-binding protein [Pigmentiphaga aceris]